MHSSTSSSEVNSETKQFDRATPDKSLRPAALIGLIVMIVMMSGWEMYWRNEGSVPSYRNSDGLWAIQRRRINRGEGDNRTEVGHQREGCNRGSPEAAQVALSSITGRDQRCACYRPVP